MYRDIQVADAQQKHGGGSARSVYYLRSYPGIRTVINDRNYLDVQNPVLEQIALTEFLKSRKMDHHIGRMRKVYAKKRETLLTVAKEAFGSKVNSWGDESGLHVALEFPDMNFGNDFVSDCRKNGIQIQTISQYCSDEYLHTNKLLLGYGHLSEKEILDGVAALKSLIGNRIQQKKQTED